METPEMARNSELLCFLYFSLNAMESPIKWLMIRKALTTLWRHVAVNNKEVSLRVKR